MELFLGILGFVAFLILIFLLEKFSRFVFFEKSWSTRFLAAAIFGFIIFFTLNPGTINLGQKISVAIVAVIVIFAMNLKVKNKENPEKE